MENQNSTGVAISETKLKVDDLGAIPNLLDKLDIEKLIVQSTSWKEVALKLHSTKLYQRISGHIIGRVILLTFIESLNTKGVGKIDESEKSKSEPNQPAALPKPSIRR